MRYDMKYKSASKNFREKLLDSSACVEYETCVQWSTSNDSNVSGKAKLKHHRENVSFDLF